jgi:hypothetical protein
MVPADQQPPSMVRSAAPVRPKLQHALNSVRVVLAAILATFVATGTAQAMGPHTPVATPERPTAGVPFTVDANPGDVVGTARYTWHVDDKNCNWADPMTTDRTISMTLAAGAHVITNCGRDDSPTSPMIMCSTTIWVYPPGPVPHATYSIRPVTAADFAQSGAIVDVSWNTPISAAYSAHFLSDGSGTHPIGVTSISSDVLRLGPPPPDTPVTNAQVLMHADVSGDPIYASVASDQNNFFGGMYQFIPFVEPTPPPPPPPPPRSHTSTSRATIIGVTGNLSGRKLVYATSVQPAAGRRVTVTAQRGSPKCFSASVRGRCDWSTFRKVARAASGRQQRFITVRRADRGIRVIVTVDGARFGSDIFKPARLVRTFRRTRPA